MSEFAYICTVMYCAKDNKGIRWKGFFLLSLFLLMGVTLGGHTLSHHHYEHMVAQISHPGHADDPDGDYLPQGDFCVLSVFAHTSFDTPVTFDVPDALSVFMGELSVLLERPVLSRLARHFSLRAPPYALI